MATKQEILDRLNKLIKDEKGRSVTIDSLFIDAELDSLGTMIVFANMDADFNFLDNVPIGEEYEGLETLTVRDIINTCILSTTNSKSEPNSEKDT